MKPSAFSLATCAGSDVVTMRRTPFCEFLGLCRPADLVQLVGVRGNHPLDRLKRAPLAGDGYIHAVAKGRSSAAA